MPNAIAPHRRRSRITDLKRCPAGSHRAGEAIWHQPSGHRVSETRARYDGICACALAFSTLLSSQGTDAHHQEPHNSIRGNPTNLPAHLPTVKLFSSPGARGYSLLSYLP